MHTLVAFLRGVNMTGHNSLKMTGLSDLFREIGLVDPETYIQSGNVIFRCKDAIPVTDIASMIEKAILEKFNYDVPAMVRTVDEMRKIAIENQLTGEKDFDPSRMAVLFLHEKPGNDQTKKLKGIDYPPDKFYISGSEIYIYCPNGFGKTRLYTNFFEKKLGIKGTARNWKTFKTILQISEKKV